MTQPSRMLSFAVCAAALLLFAHRAGAQNYVTPVVQRTPPGQLIVVSNVPHNQTDPHVDGDLVCYTDDSGYQTQVLPFFTVHYFNLATQ